MRMYRREGQLTNKNITLIRILVTIACLVLTIAGIGWTIKLNDTKNRASESVKAQIVDLDRVTESERVNGRYKVTTTEYPIVEYEVNGETYNRRLSTGRNVGAYYKGETLDININPDDPYEVYEPGSMIFAALFIAVPIFIGIFMNVILSKFQ